MSDTGDPIAVFTTQLAQVMELLGVITSATAGYRAQLEGQGFSPTAAELMAVELHGALIRKMAGG